MRAVGIAIESLDENALRAIMVRWKLAQMYLNNDPGSQERGRMAMEMLIARDFPVLLRELARRQAADL